MLDPAVSAAIKKYGVFKWACLEYPYMVFGAVAAMVGSGIGFYYGYQDMKYNTKTKYFSQYTVMRPDDPRLKNTVIWGEDGKPTNFEIKKIL